jgi:LysR family transcriptional regulator, glycine cleavage system transcriptional activator
MRIGQKHIPLKTLHIFETTGRHLNMRMAAEELSVTQSAVSHQIKQLETELGTPLFDRRKKQLALTPAGSKLLGVVGGALEDIRRGAIALDEVAFGGQFTIAAPPAFTNLWLVPRVQELLDRFPDLEMHFKTMPRIIPKTLPEADAVIQFGKSSWPRKRVTSLAVTNYTPVCSPRLLLPMGKMTPATLHKLVLIHDDDGEAWRTWLSAAGLDGLEPKRHMYVATAMDALELARRGTGIAVNDQLITSHWLATGELIAPFKQQITAYDNYYLVTDREQNMRGIVDEFESWIRQKID